MLQYCLALSYLSILKGRHLERSIKPVSAFRDKKFGIHYQNLSCRAPLAIQQMYLYSVRPLPPPHL